MECDKIREKLSAYIDGELSSEERALVEEHLKTCRECSASLDDLKKALEHLKRLEEVEPPSWFTQKTMARVRAEAEPKKGFIQKLLYPLSVRIPVGAVATVLIALVTIYVFRAIEPEVKIAKAPSEEIEREKVSPVVTEEGKAPTVASGKQSAETSIKEDETASTKEGRADFLKKREKAMPPFAPAPPLEKGDVAFEETKVAPAKPAEIPMLSKEPMATGKSFEAQKAPSPVMKDDKSMPSAGIGVIGDMKRESAPQKEKKFGYKSVSQGMEEKADKKITFTTDRKVYAQGDEVYITALNISESDASVVDRKFIDAGFARIEIMTDGYWKEIELFAVANVLVSKTLKQGETHVYTWKTAGYNRSDALAAPGIYRVCFAGQACTGSFEIKEKR